MVVSQDIRSVLRMTIEEEEEEEQEQEQQQLLLWLSYGNNSKPVSLLELAADDDKANASSEFKLFITRIIEGNDGIRIRRTRKNKKCT